MARYCEVSFEWFVGLIVIATLFWLQGCRIFDSCPDNSLHNDERHHGRPIPANNTVSFVYVVGVEGVGHHGVTPAIMEIARSCNQIIVPQNKLLRRALFSNSSRSFAFTLKRIRDRTYPRKTVTLIEDSSFPTDNYYRVSSPEEKASHRLYDLVGMHTRIRETYSINLKYLYLTRDFYRTVASHPEFDGNFQDHAAVLNDFVQYVGAQHRQMNATEPGLWRQISYEWFTEMKDCAQLVASIVDFIGWRHCDIHKACGRLAATIRQPSRKDVNLTEQALANRFDVDLPIPFLEYHP